MHKNSLPLLLAIFVNIHHLQTQHLTRVLVFSPHPDDDIIGCGGSIAKHRKNGNHVAVVFMTSGNSGTTQKAKDEMACIREREATNAELMLDVKNLYFLRNNDGQLTCDQKNLTTLVELIRQEQPDIVYIPHHADYHKDHIVTHKLVMDAIRKASSDAFPEYHGNPWMVKKILCYEIWTPLQKVSYYEDIAEFMEIKLQALRQHASQLAHHEFDAGVEGLNRYRGTMKQNAKYCEGFQLIQLFKE